MWSPKATMWSLQNSETPEEKAEREARDRAHHQAHMQRISEIKEAVAEAAERGEVDSCAVTIDEASTSQDEDGLETAAESASTRAIKKKPEMTQVVDGPLSNLDADQGRMLLTTEYNTFSDSRNAIHRMSSNHYPDTSRNDVNNQDEQERIVITPDSVASQTAFVGAWVVESPFEHESSSLDFSLTRVS